MFEAWCQRHGVDLRRGGIVDETPERPTVRRVIEAGPNYEGQAVFYVGVSDIGAALKRAEDLGGTRVMGPITSPSGLVVGHFKDPEGTLIGLAGTA